MLCSFFDCPITNFAEKRVLLYIDQPIWDKWDIVFTCYQLGTLKCSPSQPGFENYKTNSLQSLTTASLRPLQGLSTEEIASVADKLLDGTIWFSIPPNYPTNAMKLKDYCSKLKTNRTILDAMVTYCQSHDEKLNENTLTTSNILEHYEIDDIMFANFCKTVAWSIYVKGTRNTKIESLCQQACGFLDRIIDSLTSIQQVDNNFEFGCLFGSPGLLSTLLHSFPSQLQPILCPDLIVLDMLALEKEPFHKGYYIELFQFFIQKNELNDFTIVILVEIWSCNDVRQALEIAIKNSKFNYEMTNGNYVYETQSSYSYDIVLTIQFYTSESKKLQASRYSHNFEDINDENERNFNFWVGLLEMHQQCSDAEVIISLYARTTLIKACCTHRRRIACVVQTESQRITMLNNHKSFQLANPRSNNLLENSGIALLLLFLL